MTDTTDEKKPVNEQEDVETSENENPPVTEEGAVPTGEEGEEKEEKDVDTTEE